MDTADHPRRTGVSQEQIETVLSAFPHVTENQARWDLGRSGSLEMTMERLLRDGRLPTVRFCCCCTFARGILSPLASRSCSCRDMQPPANLFPPEGNVPRPRPSATAPTDAKAPTNPSRAGGPPTLIQKLNLQARAEEQDALVRDSKGKGKAVDPAEHAGRSENPVKATPGDSREDALKERKAKMVLDARWYVCP